MLSRCLQSLVSHLDSTLCCLGAADGHQPPEPQHLPDPSSLLPPHAAHQRTDNKVAGQGHHFAHRLATAEARWGGEAIP